jgi:hypothetical protein
VGLLLTVNGRNVTHYLATSEEAFDPADPEFSDPQFAGAPAFSEGAAFSADAVGNREMVFPLVLKAHPTERTNLATNPKAADGTTEWTNVSLTTFEQVTSLPGDGWPEGVTTGFHCVGDASNDLARISFPVTNGLTYRASIYLYVESLTATGLLLTVFKSGGGTAVNSSNIATVGSLVRVDAEWTADETATQTLNIRQSGAGGADWTFSAVLIEESNSLGVYFDGDDLDAVWAGTANASTSTTLVDTAGLHRMIQNLNGVLEQGAPVKFQMPAATDATHFDLERGRLEPQFEYWLGRAGKLRATLRLWTRPFGHTGTSRTIASRAATGAVEFVATGVLGDVDALANIEVRVGSKVASTGRVIGYGVHRSASFAAIRGPSSAEFVAQAGATVRGYSGALGSQALAIPVSPTGASGVALTSFLAPPGGHVGRHRLFGVMRSRLDQPVTLYARDRFGGALGPTTAASQTDATKWGLVDLGEVHVPAGGSRGAPTQYVELVGGGASGAVVVASPALELNRLIYMPLGEAPGVLRTRGAGGDSALYSDSFGRMISYLDLLTSKPTADSGEAWARFSGAFGLGPIGFPINPLGMLGPVASRTGGDNNRTGANASAGHALASGALVNDIQTEIKLSLGGVSPSVAAASSAAILWAKSLTNASTVTDGVAAKLQLGPSQFLQLLTRTAGVDTVRASAGIASILASGLYQGAQHRLVLRTTGGSADAWVATGALAALPALSASAAAVTVAGWPAVELNAGSNIASSVILIDDFAAQSVGAGASDIAGRAWFRFESHPERRTIRSNASVFDADQEAEFRGAHPQVPPVGSPGASSNARVVVFSGDPDDFLGNDLLDVRVDVTERFRFLR